MTATFRPYRINISDADLEELLLSPAQIKQLATNNLELLAALARTEITSEDSRAVHGAGVGHAQKRKPRRPEGGGNFRRRL